jgi:uncharacterized protein YgbK (DUF1537 family)
MSLHEIERAIEDLDGREYEQLCAWWEDRDAERRLRMLRAELAPAIAQADRGELIPGRAALAEILARIDRKIAAQQNA